MPEYRIDAGINFYAKDEAQAQETAKDLLTLVFNDEDVNSVEAGMPIFVKGDDDA